MTELERLDGIINEINECIAANQEMEGEADDDIDEMRAYVDGMQAALDIVEAAANKLR